MRSRGTPRDPAAHLLLLAVTGLFFIPSLIWIVAPDRGSSTTGLASAPEILGRSLLIAGGGAFFAAIFGGSFAVLISAFRVPGVRWWTPLWLAPFLLPAVVVTTGVQSWVSDGPLLFLVRGVFGAIVLSSIQMAPLILWGTARMLGALPPAEVASMRASLAPRTVARLLAGRAAPTILRLAVLAFLLLLPRLEVPAYTGVETIGRRALAAFTADGSDREGWIWCGLCLLVALPLLPFALAPLGVAGSPVGLARRDRSAPRSVGVWVLAVIVAAFPLLLGLGLLRDASGAGLGGGGESMRWVAALGRDSSRILPLAALLAVLGWRLAIGVGRVGVACSSLPLFLPGCLPALVWLEGAMPHLPTAVAGSTLPLSIVQGLRFLGVAVLFGAMADRSIPRAERNAARLLSPRVARWRVLFPRALGGISVSAALLVALLLGEVESAAQVVPPGRLLPAVELHQLLHYRYDVQAARLSLALIAVCGSLVFWVGRFGDQREELT